MSDPRTSPPFRGFFAAVHTPFDAAGALDLTRVEAQAEHLASDGITGAFVGGTTGEGLSCTAAERLALTARWAEVGHAVGLEVIAHVGANSLPEALTLAGGAAESGVDAIAAIPPTFFRPRSPEELARWYASVAAGAPELPFYGYELPALTMVDQPLVEVAERCLADVQRFAGFKFTSPDLTQLQRVLHMDAGLEVLYGNDELLLAGLAFGAHGAVGSTYNFAAPLYHRIVDAFASGDLVAARALQRKSLELVDAIVPYGFGAAAKEVMALIGVDVGRARMPLVPLTATQREALRADLERVGLFELRAGTRA